MLIFPTEIAKEISWQSFIRGVGSGSNIIGLKLRLLTYNKLAILNTGAGNKGVGLLFYYFIDRYTCEIFKSSLQVSRVETVETVLDVAID